MTPKEFLKTDKATDFENVAFTAEQWDAVYAWMNEFLTHEGQSLPISSVSGFSAEKLEEAYRDGWNDRVIGTDTFHISNYR